MASALYVYDIEVRDNVKVLIFIQSFGLILGADHQFDVDPKTPSLHQNIHQVLCRVSRDL